MSAFEGFANLHPLFVHAPLVLIPAAALFLWLGLMIRKEGFDTATLLLTVGAGLGALAAVATGLWAAGTFPHAGALDALLLKHRTNGIVVAATATAAMLLALAEARAWIGPRFWWVRAALITFAAVGVVFSGHMGSTMVYVHGAAVAPVTAQAKADAAPAPARPERHKRTRDSLF